MRPIYVAMSLLVAVSSANSPVEVSLSSDKVYIGLTSSKYLRDGILTALDGLCKPKCRGNKCCTMDSWYYAVNSSYYIDTQGFQNYDGSVTVRVNNHTFPDGYSGLREAMGNATANAFKYSAEQREHNCKRANETIIPDKFEYFCNVSKGVKVSVWKPQAYLDVELGFYTTSPLQESDRFNCTKSIKTTKQFLDNDIQSWFQKALQINNTLVPTIVICEND